MSWISEHEELAFFTEGEFSDIARLSTGVEVSGIFDENYADVFDELIEGRKYCFQVQSIFAEHFRSRDRLEIKGKAYFIVSIQPKYDGALTNIVLKDGNL